MKNSTTQLAVVTVSFFSLISAGPTGEPRSASLATRELDKRNGELYCGNFASGDGNNIRELLNDLDNGRTHSIGAHACERVACKNTSGVYVCNDKDHDLTVSGSEIVRHGNNVASQCCMFGADSKQMWSSAIGGQQFTDALGGNWNVVLGYADCNHPASQKPSTIGGWGINKSCWRYDAGYIH